jgi:hypothetical protein
MELRYITGYVGIFVVIPITHVGVETTKDKYLIDMHILHVNNTARSA